MKLPADGWAAFSQQPSAVKLSAISPRCILKYLVVAAISPSARSPTQAVEIVKPRPKGDHVNSAAPGSQPALLHYGSRIGVRLGTAWNIRETLERLERLIRIGTSWQ